MNAKRSSDRPFKPGLESSSLSIPALASVVQPASTRDCGSRDVGSNPTARTISPGSAGILPADFQFEHGPSRQDACAPRIRGGVTGNTPGLQPLLGFWTRRLKVRKPSLEAR